MNTSQTLLKRIFGLSQLILVILILTSAALAAGEVDTVFNASAYKNNFGTGGAFTNFIQPDGKILVGGTFTVANGFARNGIARLNADGTVDAQFNPPDIFDPINNRNGGQVLAIAVQSNGKIIVGGQFNVVGSSYKKLMRLNADGSIDNSFFDFSDQFRNDEYISTIVARPDDTIYLGGQFDLFNGSVTTHSYARLNSNGAIDAGFQFPPIVAGVDLAVQSEDKIYITLGTVAQRHISNGARDTAFPYLIADRAITKILIQPDGKIIVAGAFTSINGFTLSHIARVNPDGSIDTTFNPNGVGVQGFDIINDIAFGADGKIVIAGNFTSYNNVSRNHIARLNADGTLDTSFTSPLIQDFGINNSVRSVEIQPDGKIIITGFNFNILRLNPNGTSDNSFNNLVFGFGGSVFDIVQQPDGKVIAGGSFTGANNAVRRSLSRYNADGSLDVAFNPVDLSIINKIALQSDGKILIGRSTPFNGIGQLNRLNTDGSLDVGFNNLNVLIRDIEILSDDKILVNGTIRLLPNGAVDNSYATPNLSGGTVLTTFLQPDGKVLIGGTFTQVNSVPRGRIARLNADGTLDTTFAPPLGANGNVNDIALQADGKVVIVGAFTGLNGNANRLYVGRLNANGSLDESFAPSANNQLLTLKIQPDGKILIGGLMTTVNGIVRNRYARLNIDGTIDSSFVAQGGANDTVNRINLQSDGKILLGGEFTRINNLSAVGIARLLNAPGAARTPYDFDGDGKADLSVFRPSNGVWYQLNSTTNQQVGQQFGASGDQIAPADYDGDGKTDFAVYRLGAWYIQRSSQGFTGISFGASDDLPVPADYDGDGKADIAVWRPSNGTWYRINSSNGQVAAVQFGQVGDKPTLGDFDGNGISDIAVFRPSNGVWYRINALNQQVGQQFGANGDLVVPADYDGDGKTDLAVYRPANGVWYLLRTSLGFTGVQFGDTNDKPSPADYDGDGKADIAVYRPGNGVWYLQRTTQGFTGIQFGIAEDLPNPNAFVR